MTGHQSSIDLHQKDPANQQDAITMTGHQSSIDLHQKDPANQQDAITMTGRRSSIDLHQKDPANQQDAITMTGRRSSTDTGIPLYLIPAVINRHIRMLGMRTYRISVKRTWRHHYNISIRTKSLHRELRILKSPVSAPGSIGNNNSGFGGENS